MDPEERKLRIHEIRVEILLQVGTDLVQTIRFSSRSIYLVLEDTRAQRAVMEREQLDVGRLLFDDSEETELDRCRGSWRPAVSALIGGAGSGARGGSVVVGEARSSHAAGGYDAWEILVCVEGGMHVGAFARGVGPDLANDTEGVSCLPLGCVVFSVHSACGQAFHSCHSSASPSL